MKRSNWQLVLALATSALLPAMTASAKDQVPRPFKMKAHSQMVLNLADGSFSATAWGQATHCGQCISLGWGFLNPATGEGSGWGTIIAADGDQVFFNSPTMDRNIITGGTGRFSGASGEFTIVSSQTIGSEVDPGAGTMTLSFVWTASGTITY